MPSASPTAERTPGADTARPWEILSDIFSNFKLLTRNLIYASKKNTYSRIYFESLWTSCLSSLILFLLYSHLAKIRPYALQTLKFIHKQDRLNFTEDLVADNQNTTWYLDGRLDL